MATELSTREKYQAVCSDANTDYSNVKVPSYKRCYDSAKCIELASLYNTQISIDNMGIWDELQHAYLNCAKKPNGYWDYWKKNCQKGTMCTKFVPAVFGFGLNNSSSVDDVDGKVRYGYIIDCDKDPSHCTCVESSNKYCGANGEDNWMKDNCPEYMSYKNKLNGKDTDPIIVSNLVCQDCPIIQQTSGIIDSSIDLTQVNNCKVTIDGKTYGNDKKEKLNINPNEIISSSGKVRTQTITEPPKESLSSKMKYGIAGFGAVSYVCCILFCLLLGIIYFSLTETKTQSTIDSSSQENINVDTSKLF